MKKIVGIILFLLCTLPTWAHHIIGGEMYYNFKGRDGNGNYKYEIVLKLYRGTEPQDKDHALLDPLVTFSIFDNDDGALYDTILNVPLNGPSLSSKQRDDPCIVNAPIVEYQIGYYHAIVAFPPNKKGYTIAFQRCCRSDLLLNVYTQNNVGATYYTEIPGTENGILGDNSPRFKNEESILLCSKGRINYNYTATDPDGDKLVYSFYPGNTGAEMGKLVPVPTSRPPFPTFEYQPGFSGTFPLGPGVTIDSLTGEIHGRTDLQPGTYDITVQVKSYRNGKLIGSHLRDFQFQVHDCQRKVLADIPPVYNDCRSTTIHFSNNSTPDKPYLWDFGDGDTSTAVAPTHTFKTPGTYHVWIKVDSASNCGDSMQSIVKIFPGTKTNIQKSGNCIQFPVQFTDNSSTVYGNIISRSWNFGNLQDPADTSDEQNPKYQYPSTGDFNVSLQIKTDSGCVQSDTTTYHFYGKPPLTTTADTILCYKDPFYLHAQSDSLGSFRWAPNYAINNRNESNPTVRPRVDTTYNVTFTDQHGCVNTDSVRLRVKDTLRVRAGNDTTICKGDQVLLHASSDENYAFTWYNAENEVIKNARDANPSTSKSETYRVLATLGSCSSEDLMNAKVVPYPAPYIKPAIASICYGDKIQLTSGGGSSYQWSPAVGLSDTSITNPVAAPSQTTNYVLSVTDTLGCPKAVTDTFHLHVVPPVQAFAGNDTIITTGRQFQLHATGGDRYQWSPVEGLSDPDIYDPIVSGDQDHVYTVKVSVEPEGCFGYDSVSVRFINGPEVYVPSAFTPNGDGENDVFRPVPVGVTQIEYFRVYNRWGQMVYQTTAYMKGWDGRYKGKPAKQGAYVWMVKAKDFKGHTIVKKGPVLLIR